MEAVRLRLPKLADRNQLEGSGLHASLLDDCHGELRNAVIATRQAIGTAEVADLDAIRDALAANLGLQPTVNDYVSREIRIGGVDADLTTDQLFGIVALWLIDLQMGPDLRWDASKPLARPAH